MESLLFLRISLCCLFLHSCYCLHANENHIIKHKLSDLNRSEGPKDSVKSIADFRKCLFKEANEKIRQLLLEPDKKNYVADAIIHPSYNVMDSPLTTTKNLKRQTRQNMLGLGNPDLNWDKCVLKSELEEHNILEHEHMLAIKDEVEKLKQLIRLLQDQQYILSMMQNFEDKPKSKDMDEQDQLRQLLMLLRGDLQRGKSIDELDNSIPTETNHGFKENSKSKSVNISNIIEELEQLKKLIANLQDDQKEKELKQEIEEQRRELNKLRESIKRVQKLPTTPQSTTPNSKMRQTEDMEEMENIHKHLQNLEHKLSNLIPMSSASLNPSNETNKELSPNILGASLSKSRLLHSNNNNTHSELILRKAKNENEDDDVENLLNLLNKEKPKINQRAETNNLQKKLRNLINESNKKSPVPNPKIRAEDDDLLDDFQKLLDNTDSSSDFDLNFNEDLESKLSGLQKQLEISSKLKRLEKKINQMHNAESKSMDDQDEDDNIKSKIKKIEKQLKKLNNAQGRDLNDEEDIMGQLKSLQSDINRLKPKDDDEDFEISQGKDSTTAFQLALNKLLHGGKKTTAKSLLSRKLHLSPAQIQLLKKKIIAMKQGSSFDHASNIYGNGNLPYDGAFPHYGLGSGISYGSLGGNTYSGATSPGGYSRSGYGPYSTSFGKYGYGTYGSSSGSNALYTLLNAQSYESGSDGYGSKNKLYASTSNLYGLGPSSYGSNAGMYESSKNQYGINSPQGYGSQITYGQGPALYGSSSSPYQLKGLYDRGYEANLPYNAGSELYGPSGKKYGIESLYGSNSKSYGSSGIPYNSDFPYGYTSSYGPSAGPYGLMSYNTINEKYGSTPYALYSSGYTYGDKYDPEMTPYSPINAAYKTGSEPYPYGVPKFKKPTVNEYGSSKVQLKTQKYDGKDQKYESPNYQPAFGYNSGNEQYPNENKNYGININQQYGQTIKTDQYDGPKSYKGDSNRDKYAATNINPEYPSQPYANSKIYSQANPYPPASVNYVQPNIYPDGEIAANLYKPPFSEPHINVHNIFEHLAYGYKDPRSQFFLPYESEYQLNSGNYQSPTNINAQNPEQPYAHQPQNSAVSSAYTQQKVKDLKTQIYTLQNVINNLNRPEYTQKPEDKETVYKLDKKISDLKNIVSHLSHEVPYAGSSSGPVTKTGYRESSFGSGNDKDDFEEDAPIDENILNTQRRKRETNHIPKSKDQEIKSQGGIQNILQQLGDVIHIIKSFKRELFDEQNSRSVCSPGLVNHTDKETKNILYEFIKQKHKRESPEFENLENKSSNSNNPNALSNFLHRLSDVMEVISYFSQNSPKSKNDSIENSNQDQNYTTQFNEINDGSNTLRQIRQTTIDEKQEEDTKNTSSRLLQHLIGLINKVSQLAQDVSNNSCTCSDGKNCSNKKTANGNLKSNVKLHRLKKRQLNENEEDDDDDSDNKGTKLFLDKMSTFLKNILDESNDHSDTENFIEKQRARQNQYYVGKQEHWQNNHQKLQQKLEELKKQLDSKLHTNDQLPRYRQSSKSSLHNNLRASSYTNPYSRSSYPQSSYYPQPSYYPSYYMKPQYYSYPESSYESDDKKEKFKLKKKSKKSDILDKIFSKILDKIIDKVTEAIPKVTRRIFGLGVEKILNYDKDDYGYGQGGYNYGQSGYGYDQKTYAIQQSFKNMGLFGYIPLIILKLLNNLTYFVKQLQKNKFIKTFLVPTLVTAGTAGMVIFLVWWLTGDDQYGYGNYGNNYGYSGNCGNSYRSSTGDNVDNESYNRNNYDTGNDYNRRQNGLEKNEEVRNNRFRLTNANDYRSQISSNGNNNYYRYHYRDNNNDD